jgi:hypothetical protein
VGTWDTGPFDNDSAADWCGDLDEAEPERRPALVRDALTAVLDNGDEYLDRDLADEALAAAALIAAQRPGGAPVTTAYAPDFILAGGRLELTGDMPALAVKALNRILAEESEWRELWADTDEYEKAVAEVHRLQALLA